MTRRAESVPSTAAGPSPAVTAAPHAPATEAERIQRDIAVFVAAGANESVQRVITAVHGLSRRLNQWYDRQLADLGLTAGDWAVMNKLVRDGGDFGLSPSVLADAANVAPSSMTHRLDRMVKRGLVTRATDPDNRVRVRVQLSHEGWQLFRTAIQESDMLESDVLSPLSKGDRTHLAELLEMAIEGLDDLDA
jgi:DNA-binding MarR family transcriptional regulator